MVMVMLKTSFKGYNFYGLSGCLKEVIKVFNVYEHGGHLILGNLQV